MLQTDSPLQAPSSEPVVRGPRRWTRAEYQRLADLGFFDDQRVELLEGEIVRMSPQKEPHVIAVDKLIDVLNSICGKGMWTDRQLEVHRKPRPSRDRLGGRPYGEITVLSETDIVRPLAAPKAKIKVADLLP